MPDPIIKRLKHLLAIADPADGVDDGKVSTAIAKQYIATLVERAEKSPSTCPGELEVLTKIRTAVNGINRIDTLSTGEDSNMLEDAVFKGIIWATPQGKALLNIKNVPEPCATMDYSLPPHLHAIAMQAKKGGRH